MGGGEGRDRENETMVGSPWQRKAKKSWCKWWDYLPHLSAPPISPWPAVDQSCGLGGGPGAQSENSAPDSSPHYHHHQHPAYHLSWRSRIQHLMLWKSSPACDEGVVIGTFLNGIWCFYLTMIERICRSPREVCKRWETYLLALSQLGQLPHAKCLGRVRSRLQMVADRELLFWGNRSWERLTVQSWLLRLSHNFPFSFMYHSHQ